MMRAYKSALIVTLGVLALLAGFPALTAHADYYTPTQDAYFISLVQSRGVPTTPRDAVLSLGHIIADDLAANPTVAGTDAEARYQLALAYGRWLPRNR